LRRGLHWSGNVRYRGLRPTPLKAAAGIMAKINPFKFMQEVRAEAQKVTWPTRRETAITTAMVFVMVGVASVFFLVADQIMRLVVTFLLGIGG
jgi:preprotein translocase subunit SecE